MARRPPALPSVRVRMYRQGLGDCFLLTFNPGAEERHMLIDCGTLGKKATSTTIQQTVAHIRQSSTRGGNARLDAVVATHEHWDHVSAFGQPELFEDLAVGEVWMAWTEDPDDSDAQALRKHRRDLGTALAAAIHKMGADAAERLSGLLGFFSDPDAPALGAAKFAKTVDEAMHFVRTGLGPRATYKQPGDLLEPDWAPGFRFYVLGPPRSREALGDLGEHGSSHLYALLAGLRAHAALSERADLDPPADAESQMPFDQCLRQPRDRLAGWFPDSLAPDQHWRGIDHDWLAVLPDFALQLDSMTNNTSLALAVERIADRRVLLFPADAQLGSWLSWRDLEWTVTDPGSPPRRVTAEDLLGRTVFYKVGHHGSHNATPKAEGLKRMGEEGGLTAFIPVDRAVALTRNPKGSWKMPARALYRDLLKRCQGRVVRSDVGWADKAKGGSVDPVEKEFVRLATTAQWKEWREAQRAAGHIKVDDGEPFAEYTLK